MIQIYFKILTVITILFFKQRHYSPFGYLGWVGGVPPELPPWPQIDSPDPPIREEAINEVRNSIHNHSNTSAT